MGLFRSTNGKFTVTSQMRNANNVSSLQKRRHPTLQKDDSSGSIVY